MKDWMMKEIVEIIRNAEEIQKSDVSGMTKAEAKLNAYNDIAKLLDTTPENIRDHLKVVFAKIGAANRTEAVAITLKKHLLKT